MREMAEDIEGLERAPAWVRTLTAPSREQLTAAVAFELGLSVLASAVAAREDRPGPATRLFAAFVHLNLFHVLGHVGNTMTFRRYTPGIVTAPIVTLPHSLWTLWHLLRDGRLDRPALLSTFTASMPLSLTVTIATRMLGRAVAREPS